MNFYYLCFIFLIYTSIIKFIKTLMKAVNYTVKFEWDEDKNRINKQKHKISFESAVYVFDDPYLIEMYDFEHSLDEDRYIAIGKVKDILFVVYTEKKDSLRLISARLATNEEQELYYDQNIYY